MNGNNLWKVATLSLTATLLASSLLLGTGVHAQVPVDDDGNPIGSGASPVAGASVQNPAGTDGAGLSAAELEELVGPVALYPDDLLAIVLPASTYPLDIVQAARYLEQVETDPSLEPDENWDDSIVALLNYPEVVNMMNDDIDWTWALGEAVVSQQGDVILAIESFRDRAYAAGNLETDDRQTVVRNDDGVIEIEPVEEDVIYVPYYEPERVVYYSPAPVYYYYPRAYPVYYYPYPDHHYLTSSLFWGVTTAFTIGWMTDHLHVYHHSYHGHPYYGHHYGYYGHYWRRPSINVYNTWYVNTGSPYYRYRYQRGDYWRPRHRSGARPRTTVVDSGYYRNRDGGRHYDRTRDRNDYSDRTREGNTYRDRRTDGRNFNAGTRDRSGDDRRLADNTREGFSSRDRGRSNPGAASATPGSGERDRIRFRPRGDGSYTAAREERLRTSADSRRNDATAREPRNTAAARGSRTTVNPRTTVNRSADGNRGNASNAERTRNRASTSARPRVADARPSPATRSTRREAAPNRTAGFTAAPQSRAPAVRRPDAVSRGQARTTAPRQSLSPAPRQSRSTAPRQSLPSAPRQSRSTAPRQSRSSAPRQSHSTAPRRSHSTAPRQSHSSAPRSSRTARGGERSAKARESRPRNRN